MTINLQLALINNLTIYWVSNWENHRQWKTRHILFEKVYCDKDKRSSLILRTWWCWWTGNSLHPQPLAPDFLKSFQPTLPEYSFPKIHAFIDAPPFLFSSFQPLEELGISCFLGNFCMIVFNNFSFWGQWLPKVDYSLSDSPSEATQNPHMLLWIIIIIIITTVTFQHENLKCIWSSLHFLIPAYLL